MIYLHKILPFFLSPLGIIFIFLIASFFFKRRFFVFLAFIVLIVSSNPIIANYLMQKLEYPYKPIPINFLKKSDTIVVLGGVLKKIGKKNYKKIEFAESNRFFSSIELMKKSKGDQLILMSSHLPWFNNWISEGLILKDKAISLGVPREKILVTENVKNTYEESLAVKKLIPNNPDIILITSAYHMDRSKYLFEKQGFEVTPFPVDFKSIDTKISILSFLPDVSAISTTSLYIRENIGRFYYKLFF